MILRKASNELTPEPIECYRMMTSRAKSVLRRKYNLGEIDGKVDFTKPYNYYYLDDSDKPYIIETFSFVSDKGTSYEISID